MKCAVLIVVVVALSLHASPASAYVDRRIELNDADVYQVDGNTLEDNLHFEAEVAPLECDRDDENELNVELGELLEKMLQRQPEDDGLSSNEQTRKVLLGASSEFLKVMLLGLTKDKPYKNEVRELLDSVEEHHFTDEPKHVEYWRNKAQIIKGYEH